MSKTVQDFIALPVQFSHNSTAEHMLFLKENLARMHSFDKPIGRTLFVLNVPPYATEFSLKRLFSVVGPIEKVIFQSKPSSKDVEDTVPSGFKVAYIVFKDFTGVAKALKLKKLQPLSVKERPILTGIKKWLKDYNDSIYDHDQLQKAVDAYMTKYDKEVEKQKKKESKNQSDEEGWMVVTKSGRNPGVSRKESVANKIGHKKKKQLKNFYTFQIRESKMKHLAELRKKYEEDKKKINVMKQARKFKPF